MNIENHEQFAGVARADLESDNPPGTGARLALWGVLVVVVLHAALVALWVAPTNLLERKVGPARLQSYILPMWDQSWGVFAPEADSAYDLFEIRGTLRVDGVERRTSWVKVTAREVVANIRHHPFPSRTGLASTRLAAQVQTARSELSPAQQQIVTRADAKVTSDELASSLQAAATNQAERIRGTRFTSLEAVAEYYLSAIGDAVWGKGLVGIQYRTNKIRVPSYSAKKVGRQIVTGYGLYSNVRPVHALTAADRAAFASYTHEFGIG